MQNNILVKSKSLRVLIANNFSITQYLEKVSKKLKIPEKEIIKCWQAIIQNRGWLQNGKHNVKEIFTQKF